MVEHLTTVEPARGLSDARRTELAATLAALGFERRRGGRRAVFASTTLQPAYAKAQLRARGFADREFRIFLEYTRLWGFL